MSKVTYNTDTQPTTRTLREAIEEAELNLLLSESWQPEDVRHWSEKVETLKIKLKEVAA